MPVDQQQFEAEFARLGPVAAAQSIAKLMTPPLFWYQPELPVGSRVLRNGSATLITTGKVQLAITAAHVYEQYLSDKRKNPEVVCQLGALIFDPEENLVDCDQRVDLATFRLPAVPPSCIIHAPPTGWPPPLPTAEARIMLGGHPGVFRSETPDIIHGGFATFFIRTSGVGVTSVACELNLATGRPFPNETQLAPGTNLGGLSGGPVLVVIESPVFYWYAGAIIVESHDAMEIVVARPISLLDEFGFIKRGLV